MEGKPPGLRKRAKKKLPSNTYPYQSILYFVKKTLKRSETLENTMFSELQTLAGAPGFEPGPAVLENRKKPENISVLASLAFFTPTLSLCNTDRFEDFKLFLAEYMNIHIISYRYTCMTQ